MAIILTGNAWRFSRPLIPIRKGPARRQMSRLSMATTFKFGPWLRSLFELRNATARLWEPSYNNVPMTTAATVASPRPGDSPLS